MRAEDGASSSTKTRQGHDEGAATSTPTPTYGDQVLGPGPPERQGAVDQEAGERQRDGEPDE